MDLMNPMNPMNLVNPASPWYHVYNSNDDTPVAQAAQVAADSGSDTFFGIVMLVLVVIAFGSLFYTIWTDI